MSGVWRLLLIFNGWTSGSQIDRFSWMSYIYGNLTYISCLVLIVGYGESGVIFVLKQIIKLARNSIIHGIRMTFRSRSLVVRDFRSETQIFPVQVHLLDMCRDEISGIISRLMFKCLWSGGNPGRKKTQIEKSKND